MSEINLPAILVAHLITVASVGPSTLAIAGTSMMHGRRSGLILASAMACGSATWSVAAAMGLSAIMLANAWVSEVMRYLGAAYLLFLAYKSLRSMFSKKDLATNPIAGSAAQLFAKGLLLHLTNPKAILFFGALFSIGVPVGSPVQSLAMVVVAMALQSMIIFVCYAFMFSMPSMTRHYLGLRRWFEGAFAFGFGAAAFKVLTARLTPT